MKRVQKAAWVASSSRGNQYVGSFAGGLVRLFFWSFFADRIDLEYQEDVQAWIFEKE